MRFAIVIFIFLSIINIGCSTEDKATPQVVLSGNPAQTGTTTTTNSAVSSQEVYSTFVRLALKSSDGATAMTIRKWQPSISTVKIYWDNGSDATLLKYLDKIISDINSLSKSNKFARTTNASEAHFIINRTTATNHTSKYSQYKVTNPNMSGETYTVWGSTGIQKSVMWLSPTVSASLLQGVIRHEILHGLGLGHTENAKSIMIPVMSAGNYDFGSFSNLDKSVISILQDTRVQQGDNESAVSAIIKEYAAKASSAREIATETHEVAEGTIKCHFIEVKND